MVLMEVEMVSGAVAADDDVDDDGDGDDDDDDDGGDDGVKLRISTKTNPHQLFIFPSSLAENFILNLGWEAKFSEIEILVKDANHPIQRVERGDLHLCPFLSGVLGGKRTNKILFSILTFGQRRNGVS